MRTAVEHLSAEPPPLPPEWEKESRWQHDSDGNFRERFVRSPVLELSEDSLRALPQYERSVQLLEADAVIGAHVNQLVGTVSSASQLQARNVLWSLIYAMVDDDGRLEFSDERFDKQWREQSEFFAAEQIAYKTVAPLPKLLIPNAPLQLSDRVWLDKLTAEEVTRCAEIGVLRPLPRLPMIFGEDAVGIRAVDLTPKVIHRPGERIARAVDDIGKFGNRPRLNAQLIVDDVLAALHLFKHGRVRVAGYAIWSDSWWLKGGTSYRCLRQWPYGQRYELTEGEVPHFLELWRQLEKSAEAFRFGIRRFNLAFDRDLLEERIVDLVIAAEALFLGDQKSSDRGELSFRFALRAAKFIDHPKYGQRDIFSIMRVAYHARSRVVHGGSLPTTFSLPSGNSVTASHLADEIEELVRLALRKALSVKDKGKNLHQSAFWDDLLFEP